MYERFRAHKVFLFVCTCVNKQKRIKEAFNRLTALKANFKEMQDKCATHSLG